MIFVTAGPRWLGNLFTAFLIGTSTLAGARSYPDFQEVLRDVLPAVVHISTSERPLQSADYLSPHKYFFQIPEPQGSRSFALGTGFLINPKGYCVTSLQAIEGAHHLEVISAKKQRWKATLVGGDRLSDLALLKLEGAAVAQLPSLELGDSDRLAIGDPVLAVGLPLGFQAFLTEGRIAAKGNVLGSGPFNRHFILDLLTHPGNAGGPLVDGRGRVIGMATYVAKGPVNLGFALPSKILAATLKDLQRHGKVLRSWLGIVAHHLVSLDQLSEAYAPGLRSGLLVDNLIIDGPAAKAGLQVGDLIVSQEGNELRELAQLQEILARTKPGQSLALKVFRRKQGFISIQVQVGEIPSAVDLPATPDLI